MKAGKRILISTGSFGEWDSTPLQRLEKAGLNIQLNPYGRKLKEEEIIELAAGAVGILAGTEPLNSHVLNRLEGLKVISRCGVGMDNVDLSEAKGLGIKVYNTPDGPTQAVAELTVSLVLNLLRQVSLMDRELRNNIWNKRMGLLLSGKRIGIIGFGRIGKKVAEMLYSLGTEVSYCDPAVQGDQDRFNKLELFTLLKESDIVCLHLALSASMDKPLIGGDELSSMKKDSFLVNCSRGGVVDEKALYESLKNGRLAGAAVDVFDSEPYEGLLQELDNIILTPHIGSYAKETRIKMEMQAAENLIKGLGG